MTARHPMFQPLKNDLEHLGYTFIPVDISWKQMTHSRYIKQFVAQYSHLKSESNIVIGNSFGAVVALLAADIFKPDRLVLCSLSPFFKESLSNRTTYDYAVGRFGKRRVEDLKKYSIKEIASVMNLSATKIDFLYGEYEKEEYPLLVDFTQKYNELFLNSGTSEVKSAPHSLKNPYYQKFVVELLKGKVDK
ncbi:MAG: alpha/beta hydrolase [Candidatus Saccharibacteria bacterium]|nr:alpha/beta hydrolase [Candidatus Saccharibacteria bacterium]